MKYILILITIVLIALTFYLYIEKNPKEDTKYTVVKKILPPTEKVSTYKLEKYKDIQKKIIKNNNHSETFVDERGETITMYHTPSNKKTTIGQGITLESIQNSDLSEKEKELLVADMIYYQSIMPDEIINLSEEEALNLIKKDLEEGIIK